MDISKEITEAKVVKEPTGKREGKEENSEERPLLDDED
jgi:hypothetical protein